MQIDWFTFAAQIVNFLVLVWLLKKFLYKPVLAAMERRKATLAAKFQEAEDRKNELEQEHNRLKHKELELETSIEQEMAKARLEAEALKKKLMEEVRREADASRDQWLAALEKEKKRFLGQAGKMVSQQFHHLSRNALAELADDKLEARVINTFIAKLKDDKDLAEMLQSTAAGEPFNVYSSFQMETKQRQELGNLLNELSGTNVEPEFMIDDSLIAGIALEVDGKKVRWDLHHYLENFHREVEKTLQQMQEVS